MLLSDLGADVVMVDRKDRPAPAPDAVTHRGRRHLPLDLKNAAAIEACLMLAERADILIEGFRPGVMERLGLLPEVTLARNPALVYGRILGWGQSGQLADWDGHDVTYIASSVARPAINQWGTPGAWPHSTANVVGGRAPLSGS